MKKLAIAAAVCIACIAAKSPEEPKVVRLTTLEWHNVKTMIDKKHEWTFTAENVKIVIEDPDTTEKLSGQHSRRTDHRKHHPKGYQNQTTRRH